MANKLYESNSIEIWKEIAYQVQRLSIKEYKEKEFYENLKKLEKLLANIDVDLGQYSERYPESENDIGLATLLQAIYSIKDVGMHYKKAKFYEKIHQLSDIGIKNIRFNPVYFPSESVNLYKSITLDEGKYVTAINKTYTDGNFDLRENNDGIFTLKNINNANYLLYYLINGSMFSSKNKIKESIAILKNFDGDYPSIEEVESLHFPKIHVPSQTIEWSNYPKHLEESYERFDTLEASYEKRLTRTKDNQYYYKEYKNK